MASVTQTVQSYNGGISEQPDQLKLPGQVADTENSIPDITYGLYKRPGATRIRTAKLANVQGTTSTKTTLFHYYRDETEGSYIGEVATDGKIRMWCTKDIYNAGGTKVNSAGDEIFVHYAAVSGAYTQSNYNSGTASHTSITNYLSASNTEDVQALTINDSTFLNNRDTVVTTTGTTDSRPHTYSAFVDLLRTENGRQYALNIHDPAQTGTTNNSVATQIKIKADNLTEGAGTGRCTGIGTQVFSVDSGSKKNLIYRITTLGQQGRMSGDGSSDSHYACTYNRNVELLHGGEGWADGDETGNISMTASSSSYTYNIEVEKHETIPVRVTINGGANGLIRPRPTPFDADTAVTPDTILGGIVSELSGTGLSYQIIGNGIYIYSDSQAFNVEIVERDLMRVMQGEVNDVSELPQQCKHGYIVKVSNTRNSEEDDYYVKFVGENNTDGVGSWQECAAPGVVKSLNAATMPHILQRQAISGTNPIIFLVKEYSWADREVGDDVTNPKPTFADGSSKINRVLFFRNRLVFLSGENVITSRAGGLNNFWLNSALTVSGSDPVDISSSSTFPSELFDGIETPAGLLCFSTNQQFLLASDDTIFNPDTAKLRAIATYNYNKELPPINMGTTTGFIDNSGKYSRFQEMANISREGKPDIVEASKLVPSLLPNSIDLVTNSRENGIVMFSKHNTDIVYGFKYFNQADQRQQSAWFKWKHNVPIKYHFIVDDTYYFLDKDNFLQSINILQAAADPSIDQDSVNYLLHLDNHVEIEGGVFDSTTRLTTFTHGSNSCVFNWQSDVSTNPVPNGKLIIVDSNSATAREGRYAEVTVTSAGATFTVPGDWSSATVHIGYLYEYNVKFPRLYVGQQVGQQFKSDINSSLVVHRLKLAFGKIGLYATTLERVGKSDYTEIYESTTMDEYDVADAPYLDEHVQTVPVYEKNSNVDITVKSSHPAPATLRSMSWEGDYSPKYYRRV